MLSRRFHVPMGQRGTYTRKRGLDRQEKKALLLLHLRDPAARSGVALAELQQVLPELSRFQIHGLLDELRGEGRVSLRGTRRHARWFASFEEG
jgi:ATP-dependent DNA helicase RecG